MREGKKRKPWDEKGAPVKKKQKKKAREDHGLDVRDLEYTEYHSSEIIRCPGYPDCCIVNVVSKFNIGHVTIDMEHWARTQKKIPVEYNPTGMKACVLRLESPGNFQNCTMLIFESGNFVITGASTIAQARKAAHHVAIAFQENGYIDTTLCSFQVTNIVAAMYTGFEIDLMQFKTDKDGEVEYFPELFPAARYVPQGHPSMKVLVYGSGKLVFTGAQSEEEIAWALKITYDLIRRYKMDPNKMAGGRYEERRLKKSKLATLNTEAASEMINYAKQVHVLTTNEFNDANDIFLTFM